jgi:hypothetical protein
VFPETLVASPFPAAVRGVLEDIDKHEYEYLREIQAVLFDVLDAPEHADVDESEQKLVASGRRISIEEVVQEIHSGSGWPCDMILGHVVGWLEMMYDPANLDESQMEELEKAIDLWVNPYGR